MSEQVDMVSPTAGDQCCSPAARTPSPLDKPAGFEGVRDVHVSVSLMEDFMRCADAGVLPHIPVIHCRPCPHGRDRHAIVTNWLAADWNEIDRHTLYT